MLKSFSLSQSGKTMGFFPIYDFCVSSLFWKRNFLTLWCLESLQTSGGSNLYLATPQNSHSVCPPCTTTSNPEKNNNNKHNMIIFLITEPGNTKENCGICRQMPRAPPVRSAVFVLFFSLSLLNFVCDFFGLLKHIPIILRSHSKFPMPQQHCAAGESPEDLILGGCRLPRNDARQE